MNSLLDAHVSRRKDSVVFGDEVEDVFDYGQQGAVVVKQLDRLLRAEESTGTVRAPVDGVEGGHPDDLGPKFQRDTQRLRIEASDAVVEGDSSVDIEVGELVLERPGDGLCGVFMALEDDAGHPPRSRSLCELSGVHAAFCVRIGSGMNVDVDRAFKQGESVVGRLPSTELLTLRILRFGFQREARQAW